ncbi:hypothetical protein HUU51_02980 [Candidatus Gracilibacteria bacterium]|nr:hypothetical protein [Candidatus Gracilibacteria bacterium]
MAEIQGQSEVQVPKVEAQNKVDTSNLTPEQQRVYERIESLKTLLDSTKAQEAFSRKGAQILGTRLSADPEVRTDPEAKPTIEMYNRYMARFNEAVQKGGDIKAELAKLESEVVSTTDKVEFQAGINEAGEKLKFDNENLKTLSSKEFLSLSPEERLQYVTQDNIDSDSVSSGYVTDITFSFDQDGDGNLNKELYMLTTAGQVLPKEIRQVTKDGQVYNRIGLTGEFYNGEKRLTIHDKTKVTLGEPMKAEELNKISEENIQKYNEFVEKNPEFKDEKYNFAINEAIEKGIEPKMFLKVLSRRIEEFEKQASFEKTDVEFISTEVTKVPGYEKTGLEATANSLRYLTPTTWKQSLGELGYDKASIDSYHESNKEDSKYYSSKLENFTPAEYSYPAERSESGTTLCSRTARLNLSKLGVDSPSTGGSARAAYENLNSPKDIFPPTNSDAKVADVYLDARSDKNRQYGHRVAAFKGENGQWFVLDPYYSMFGNTREPIPAEHYVRTVGDKQKVWGAHYYS